MCYWPPFCEVCLNYDVVMFQPQIFTTPDLGSINYCCLYYLLNLPHPILLLFQMSVQGGRTTPTTPNHPSTTGLLPHGIILPPGHHLSQFQHTKNLYLPLPHPSLPESGSSSHPLPLLRLPKSRGRCSLFAAKISFNMPFRCFSASACHHC